MAEPRLPLTVKNETVAMMGNPIKVSAIVVEENKHCRGSESKVAHVRERGKRTRTQESEMSAHMIETADC